MKKKKQIQENYLDELEKSRKSNDEFKYSTKVIDPENPAENENNVDKSAKPEKKKRSKYPIYIGLILVITGITMYFSLVNDAAQIGTIFVSMNIPYFIYGVLCFLGVFIINSFILWLFARRYRKKYYFHQAMANDCIGNFFNCITPSASGGQLMQAYTFKKQGIPIANATSCLVMNFIVYQLVMIVIASISVFVKSAEVFEPNAYNINIGGVDFPFWVIMVLGYALQFIVIALLLLMATWRKFHNLMLNQGVNLLAKMKIIKNPDEKRRSFAVAIESFKVELKNLVINPRFLILIIICHIACFVCRYTIPHFINQAVLGDSVQAYRYTWWDTFCYTSIHKMATELIPIPGSAGVSELLYFSLFKEAYLISGGVTQETISAYTNASQILWRVITFHAPLVITALVSAFYKGKPSKEERSAASKGAATYLTLTIDTFDDRKRTYQTIYNTQQINKKEFDKWKKANKNKDEK